jgi:hypothetical protein
MLIAALALPLSLTAALPPCRVLDARLPRPLAGWTRSGAGLDTGHAVILPVRRGQASTSVRIRRAGSFGIAVDQPGWIDISRQRGRPLAMTSEARGPICSTVRKIVRYRLSPGVYRVTVARLRADRARLMLVRY